MRIMYILIINQLENLIISEVLTWERDTFRHTERSSTHHSFRSNFNRVSIKEWDIGNLN